MRSLITGAAGLAGGWLVEACVQAGDDVLGLSRSGTVPAAVSAHGSVQARAVDLRDAEAVRSTLRTWVPDIVYHLAALSSVGRSWSAPGETVAANVGGAASLLEALRLEAQTARVVWVSSSEVYGTATSLPIDEGAPTMPESPYAVSKLAAEQLAQVYAHAHGLSLVIARPFSHSGPRQRPIFLMSNLVHQVVTAQLAGRDSLQVRTGNGEVRRDVTDARDVVAAYRLLAASSLTGIFNVCTGVTRSTAEQVAELGRVAAPLTVEHVVDPALVRASEVMELRGDPSKLTRATGWRPQIPYEQTLRDMREYWQRELAA